jgi:hypothetical protein
VGTASRVQIAEGAGSNYYLVLAGGVGNTGIFVDTSGPRWTYNASTGELATGAGSLNGNTITATTGFYTGGNVSASEIYSNSYFASDTTSPIIINTPVDDGTSRGIIIGDYNDAGNGTIFTLDDANTRIEISAVDVDCFANMNVRGGSDLRFYVSGGFTYVGFKAPTGITANKIWTLPSTDGSSNQVLTTNGSGTLSWSTPTGGGSSVTSFNGLTGAVTGVSRVNGLTGAVVGIATTGSNVFTGLQTMNAGLTTSHLYVSNGATFGGQANFQSNTVYKPTLQYYNEPTSSPSISSNVLTLDLSAAQVFTVSLNANINTFTISNTPATASRAMSFTLIFTADGTARTVTWGSSVKWANGTAPVLTSTNTKKDVFTFMTTDAGTSWLGFVAGQNF